MFKIEYLMHEDGKKRISRLQKETNWDIEGQICLVFNDKKVGFYEEKIDYSSEYLYLWFRSLLDVIKELKRNDNSVMQIPETENELHFKLKKNTITVIKRQYLREIYYVSEGKTNIKKEWIEEIDYNNFQCEVQKKVKQFLIEVKEINSIFLETDDYRKLVCYLDEIKI